MVENKNLEGSILKTKCQQFEFKSVKGFEPRSHFLSRLIMIFRVNVVRIVMLLTATEVLTTCAVVIC